MDTVLRRFFNQHLQTFFYPLHEGAVELSLEDGLILKNLIMRPHGVNEQLARAGVDVRVDGGQVGHLRLCYTNVPGIVTVQLKNVDVRVRPNALKTVSKTVAQKVGDLITGAMDYVLPDDQRQYYPGYGFPAEYGYPALPSPYAEADYGYYQQRRKPNKTLGCFETRREPRGMMPPLMQPLPQYPMMSGDSPMFQYGAAQYGAAQYGAAPYGAAPYGAAPSATPPMHATMRPVCPSCHADALIGARHCYNCGVALAPVPRPPHSDSGSSRKSPRRRPRVAEASAESSSRSHHPRFANAALPLGHAANGVRRSGTTPQPRVVAGPYGTPQYGRGNHTYTRSVVWPPRQ